MSAAMPTPGPWVVDDSHPGDRWRYVMAPTGGIPFAVCRISLNDDGCGPTPAEAEVNARLIAAAPELLYFLEEYIEAWKYGMAGDSFLMRIAEKVLAKATGESA